jgi:hypothetical protein
MNVTRAEHNLHVAAFVDDHVTLARFALARFSFAAERRLVVAFAFNEDSDIQWAKVASYALNELRWIEADRPLTPVEKNIRTIAERVYDSCVVVAKRLDIDLHPEDTDKQAAREQFEKAYARAVFELTNLKGDSDE